MEQDEFELLQEAREILDSQKINASHKFSDDILICECNCVSAKEIRTVINNNEVNIDILSKELGLGSGCSSCVKRFAQWKDKI